MHVKSLCGMRRATDKCVHCKLACVERRLSKENLVERSLTAWGAAVDYARVS